MSKVALLGAALCSLLATSARADWEGTARSKIEPPPPMGDGPQFGKISGKGGKIRMETSGPMGKGAAILDPKTKSMTMVLEERKAFIKMDLEKLGGGPRGPQMQLVACDGEDPAPCLEAGGFKKAGSEKVNGQQATKWTRDRETPRGMAHQELWAADGFKEFALLRQVTKTGERTMTIDVEGLKKAPQDDALFKVPAGYQDMSEMMQKMMPGGPRRHGRPSRDASGRTAPASRRK